MAALKPMRSGTRALALHPTGCWVAGFGVDRGLGAPLQGSVGVLGVPLKGSIGYYRVFKEFRAWGSGLRVDNRGWGIGCLGWF